jgi:hypothetical protein
MKPLLMLIAALCAHVLPAQTKPPWLSAKPADPSHYVGIGSAAKTEPNYAAAARKNALVEIANEIEMPVSGTSILNQIAKSEQVKKEYRTMLKATLASEMRDTQRMGVYEDETTHWVYYRLNRAAYAAQQQRDLENIKIVSLQFFEKAQDAVAKVSYATAIDFYFRSLLTLKKHWADDIEVSVQGKPVFLAVESFARLQQLLDRLNIRTTHSTLRLPANGNARATLDIVDAEGRPGTKLPLLVHSVPTRTATATYTTNERGEAHAVFPASVWNQTREVEVVLDLQNFSKSAIEDRLFEKLTSSLRVPTTKINIETQR